MMEINPNRIKFYEFLNGDISIGILETWIFHSKKLEIVLSADDYFDLIELNFRGPKALPFITSLVKRVFDWNEYEKWRTVKLLEEIKNGSMEAAMASKKLRELHSDQEREMGKSIISEKFINEFEQDINLLKRVEQELSELLKKDPDQ